MGAQSKLLRRAAYAPWLFALLTTVACARTTTVVLVRHAERDPITAVDPDPALTAVGQTRAQILATAAGDAGVSAIYVTDSRRTQQTAAPLATRLSLTPRVFPIAGNPQQHARSIADDILNTRVGSTVVVVGHSDTVPLIIEALGFAPAPTIATTEFGHLFVLMKRERGGSRLLTARYGQ